MALLCLLLPAAVQAKEKTGVYVTPKFTVNFMNWKMASDVDGVHPLRLGTYSSPYSGAGSFDFSDRRSSTLWGGALAMGYDFYPRFDLPLRLEVEYGIYSNTQGSSDYVLPNTQVRQILNKGKGTGGKIAEEMTLKLHKIQTLLLNAYWDFHNSTDFTPYIGAGLGLAFIQVKGSSMSFLSAEDGSDHSALYDKDFGIRNNTNFAWQVGAGCSYALTDDIALDLGYRFMSLGNVRSNSVAIRDEHYTNCDMFMNGKTEAKNIYMHQIALGLRISF